MNVYISGNKGFIGSALKEKFLFEGHKVIDEDIELSDISKLKIYDVDLVIHCAAIVGTVACDLSKKSVADINIEGTYRISEVSKFLGAEFINMSSVSIYDFSSANTIISENSKILPHTWYGMTKYLSEISARKMYDEDLLTLRLGFVYGDPNKDPHSAISSMIRDVYIPMVGNYFKDYIYIDDCVNLVYLLWKNKSRGIFNIGSGSKTFVSDIVNIIKPKNFVFEEAEDYYKNFVISTDKISGEINWIPKTNTINKIKELKFGYDN